MSAPDPNRVITIPGLPRAIEVVPPAPYGPDDPDSTEKRAEWLRWRENVIRHRIERRHAIRESPKLAKIELQRCANHPAYLAATWLSLHEPRRRKIGTGRLPFIPFAEQVQVMDTLLWTLGEEDENADAVWSKCRGWGATWIGGEMALWAWRFSYMWGGEAPLPAGPADILMLSAKEELVDSKKKKAIFRKIDHMLQDFPDWMMPQGFDWMRDRMKLSLLNPDNENEIVGESTTANSGRGDRALWAWLDEMATMPEALHTWATVADTTDHRWGVSTESIEQGMDWVNLRKGRVETGITPKLIESDWWQNPMLDDAWLEKQRLRNDVEPGFFEREIMRNPEGGMSDTWIYSTAREMEPNADVVPIPARNTFIFIDPGMRDSSVIILGQQNHMGGIDVLDSFSAKGQPADYYAPILKPDLFGMELPTGHAEWVPTAVGAIPEAYQYDERGLNFCRVVEACAAKPKFIGDTYGANVMGATADSVYSRWERYGIVVNKDRRKEDGLSAFDRQARTHQGRQQALRERIKTWRFATTPGAIAVLQGIQQYQNQKNKKPTTSPMVRPLHDDVHSHYATACEFMAVYLRQLGDMANRKISKSVRSGFGVRTQNFGSRNRALRGLDQWTA